MRKMPDDWVSCWNVPQSIKTGRLLLWHRLLLGIAAIHPGNLVPGVDVTPDPLLQGRLFSYQDTQLIRLGGPNFHELPVNRAVCPFHNFQRDGHMRSTVAKGRVAYEPNSLDPNGVRENPKAGYRSFPDPDSGPKLRQRAESFADHYSQARQFYRSMTPPEKTNIVRALCFELGKVETTAVRTRMLGHLDLIEPELGRRVAEALGMAGEADKMVPAVQPRDDLDPSQALSLVAKAPKTLQGRTVAVLVTEGSDVRLVDTVRTALGKQKATVKIVAPKAGKMKIGVLPDMTIDGGPSCLFDGIVLLSSADGTETLLDTASAGTATLRSDRRFDEFGTNGFTDENKFSSGRSGNCRPSARRGSSCPEERLASHQSQCSIGSPNRASLIIALHYPALSTLATAHRFRRWPNWTTNIQAPRSPNALP
jgi:hypothetical protein